jgi:DNA-binding CsgD family transcriptional regulator
VLRETASFARALGLAGAAGEARGFARVGAAYRLDDQLRCATAHPALASDPDSEPVIFTDGKPRAARTEEQAGFEAALLRAARRPFAYSTLLLSALDGNRRAVVRLAPVVGSATSLFIDTHVIMLVTPVQLRREPPDALVPALIEMFGLTPAEAKAAALIGCGWVPREAASRLEIGEGTLRNHLKASFAKMGVTRQVHLSQLVAAVAG